MAPKAELSALEERILRVLREHPEVSSLLKLLLFGHLPSWSFTTFLAQGLADEDLNDALKDVTSDGRVDAINRLLSVHRLSISQTSAGLTYKGIEADEALR